MTHPTRRTSCDLENIPLTIEDLDQAQTAKAFAAQAIDDDKITLNAMSNLYRDMSKNYKPVQQKPRNSCQPNRSNTSRRTIPRTSVTNKFCRICNLAGSDPRIYTSNEISNGSRLTIRDMDSLRNCLTLNSIVGEEDP